MLKSQRTRSKWFSITIHDTTTDIESYKEIYEKAGATAFRAQHETCPKTGKEHYQGIVGFDQKTELNKVIKIRSGVHTEPAKDAASLWKYCGKDDTRVPGTEPFEWGRPPPAKRNCKESI